ncbi:MAG: fasciclin domain-containing protein, partial [Dermatophilaceae bacterium]
DPDAALTAFLPQDNGFITLAYAYDPRESVYEPELTEEQAFGILAENLGIDTIEQVLLFHVVPGETLEFADLVSSPNASLATALPDREVTVRVYHYSTGSPSVLIDDAADYYAPLLRDKDINAGNPQVAHGFSLDLLRPFPLEP